MTNTKRHSPLTVKIGDKEYADDDFTVISFSRSFGGSRVDQAIVNDELGTRRNQHILNDESLFPIAAENTLELFHNGSRVFWGVIEDVSYQLGNGDTKTLIASIQSHHFGDPLTAVQYLDARPTSRRRSSQTRYSVVAATENVVFNGFVDGEAMMSEKLVGKFVGNKAGRKLRKFPVYDRDGRRSEGKSYLPIPLESVQTQAGRDRYRDVWTAGTDTTKWDLRDAVEYICLVCNPNETFIDNPNNADLEGISDFVLPRTELQLGRYLPDYLDQLLEPYGHFWYVDVSGNKPRIAFAQWGVGEVVDANYAAFGKNADFDTTNLIAADAMWSISQNINEVHVIGGQVEFEVTVELHRVSYDKWALNEAGDYQTSTFEQARVGPDATAFSGDEVAFPDLTALLSASALGDFGDSAFIQHVYRRGRFLPTITQTGVPSTGGDSAATELRPIGPNNGFDIEIIDLRQDDASETEKVWVNIDEMEDPMWRHVRVLADECAIVFDRGRDQGQGTADDPDSEHEAENSFMVALSDGARVRITATIVADFAVQVRVTRDTKGDAQDVATKKHTFVWHNPHRWPCRRVLTSGRYKSKYAAESYFTKTQTADEIIANMKKEARKILDRTDCAIVSGGLTFFGLHNNVPLGGIVKKIAGRELDFGMRREGDTQVYPQVVSVHWDAQAATITAQMSTRTGGFDGLQ